MLYDDVDLNAVDANDFFGVAKTAAATDSFKTSASADDNEATPANKSVLRKLAPKWEVSVDWKIPAKQSRRVKPDNETFVTAGGSYNNSSGNSSFVSGSAGSSVVVAPITSFVAGEGRTVEKQYEVSTDFRSRVAVTFQEKLATLEERDRYLRENVHKEHNKNMDLIVMGTCPDMCPEKERLLREINCSFSSFEAQIVRNEMLVVPELLVKEYSRSSADQDEPLPHELRPEPVLVDTMSHILANIVPRIEDSAGTTTSTPVDAGEWYHFCWDRLRSIRKDIVQQQLCSVAIVAVLEYSARFHICCAERLFEAERRVFDHKINAENLVNCLQMLINMYDDLAALGIRCPNESEFRVYMMLLMLSSGDVPDLLDQRHDDDVVEAAARIYFAFKLSLYAKFFKLVKKTSYLNACILQRYFGGVRTHTLNVLVSAYSSGSQQVKFPVSFARRILEFDDDEETVAFAEAHGFAIGVAAGGSPEIRCSKSSFVVPEQLPTCKSSHILRAKRVPMLQAITKTTPVAKFAPQIRLGKVHSSFEESDMLREEAWLADDQRRRVVELYGNVYECSEDEEMAGDDESMRMDTPVSDVTTVTGRRASFSPKFAVSDVTKMSPSSTASVWPATPSQKAKMLTSFSFGSILQPQLPPPSSATHFRFSDLPELATVIGVGSDISGGGFRKDQQLDFGIAPICADDSSTFFLPEKSSGSALYDPEDVSDGDVDDDHQNAARVPELMAVTRCENVVTSSELGASGGKAKEMAGFATTTPTTPDKYRSVESRFSSPLSKKSPSPPVCITRDSNEVAARLANALDTFQSLYYNRDAQVVPSSINETSRSSLMLQLPARKLRKLVRRRLKRSRARKYVRLWRKKAQLRRHRRDNFVGVVHLSPDEYFKLWGRVGDKERLMAQNIVTEVMDSQKAMRWSTWLLPQGRDSDGDEHGQRVPFVGNELAETICKLSKLRSRPFVCCKILVSLPQCRNDGQIAFVSKISKLVRNLYCAPDTKDDDHLGGVWRTHSGGIQICVSANVRQGAVVDVHDAAGVTCVVTFVCEKWENCDKLRSRLESICCEAAYPPYVGAIVIGNTKCDAYTAAVTRLLTELRIRNTIAGYSTTSWKRWSTIHQVVTEACARVPYPPPFQVHSIPAFVRQVGGDLFACLQCPGVDAPVASASPVPFIRAYNECLAAATRIVCMRGARDFNLCDEFVEALTMAVAASVRESRTNFTHPETIASAANDFSLLSFTKWPPKSVRKMESLLTDYCRTLDASNALLANVLRMVGGTFVGSACDSGRDSVEEMSARAPWLQIVELWFQYRLRSVSSEKYEKFFVIYAETEVKELVERVAIEQIN